MSARPPLSSTGSPPEHPVARPRTTSVDESARIRLRITIVNFPAGTKWALQLGKSDLVPPVRAAAGAAVFEADVELATGSATEPLRLRGAVVQGRPGDRFLYLNSGTYAGDRKSIWSRRAKVRLSGITASLAKTAARKSGILECHLSGTAKDGGPACASVIPLAPGWVAA